MIPIKETYKTHKDIPKFPDDFNYYMNDITSCEINDTINTFIQELREKADLEEISSGGITITKIKGGYKIQVITAGASAIMET